MNCNYCGGQMGTGGCMNYACPNKSAIGTVDVSQQPPATYYTPQQIQLDRIEAKLDQLLARKKRKPKPNKTKYSIAFEQAWKHYPKRSGNNPKNKANATFCARFQEEFRNDKDSVQIQDEFVNGVKRYADYCKATGKTGTEFVLQAATFFGPDKHY